MDLGNVTKLKALTELCQHEGCLRKATHEVENVDNPDLTLNFCDNHYKQTNDEE